MTETVKIPLFPLGLVLLPDMHLPLHIFEARYKEMISRCLVEDTSFGIVLFDGQSIRWAGCMARITRVLKHYADGRMDIMTRGGRRFIVRKWIQDRSYMEAEVLFFDDVKEQTTDRKMEALIESAMNLIRSTAILDMDALQRGSDGRTDPESLSFAIAGIDGFTPAERQGILEMVSPRERLQKCVAVLSRLAERNRLTKKIQEMIRGNGHPPKSILREFQDIDPDGGI